MSLYPTPAHIGSDEATLIETVGEFAKNELLPRDRAWDKGAGRPGGGSVADVLPQLSEMGLLNLLVPQEFGGLGCRYPVFAAIIHELAVWSPATSVTVAVHSMTGGIIDRFAHEPLRSELLSHWGNPKNFGAFALSEAGAGSDATAITVSATEVPGGFRINGEKMWVSNGMNAGWLFTLTRLSGAKEDETFCAFLVDGRAAGVSRDEIHGKMGIRGSETAVVHYADVFVPESALVGEPGQGLGVCLKSLGRGRVGIAAQATGIAEACLSEMVSYSKQREQFGRPIGKFQAVADLVAQSAMELEAAKELVWRAASDIETGRASRSSTSMAKLYASEAANRIAYRAVQVHGGTGYVNDSRVEQLYRDARVTTIYEGTSEIQRLNIARELAAG
jgi:alkylation response protein AidB-like acyl-CoA dehydrogenase